MLVMRWSLLTFLFPAVAFAEADLLPEWKEAMKAHSERAASLAANLVLVLPHEQTARNNAGEASTRTALVARFLCHKYIHAPPVGSVSGFVSEEDAAACEWLEGVGLAPLRTFLSAPQRVMHEEEGGRKEEQLFRHVFALKDTSLPLANQEQRVVVAVERKPSSSPRSPMLSPSSLPSSLLKTRRPLRLLVIGDSNAVVWEWIRAVMGAGSAHADGSSGNDDDDDDAVFLDVRWVVGASAYGMGRASGNSSSSPLEQPKKSRSKSGAVEAFSSIQLRREAPLPLPLPPPPLRSGRDDHEEREAREVWEGFRYDWVLVQLGFVDCNYVAPFRKQRARKRWHEERRRRNASEEEEAGGREEDEDGYDEGATVVAAAHRLVEFAESMLRPSEKGHDEGAAPGGGESDVEREEEEEEEKEKEERGEAGSGIRVVGWSSSGPLLRRRPRGTRLRPPRAPRECADKERR